MNISSQTVTYKLQTYQLASKMEKIISSPGLQHLAEKVFWNLDIEDLKICAQINQSCKQILEDAMFWLGMGLGLSFLCQL